MDISVKQYAQGLYESVVGKSRVELKPLIENFADILQSNNDLAKSRGIITEFSELWNRENGIVEAEVISANKLDKETVKKLSDYIGKDTEATDIILSEKIEKSLLGGAVLKYGNRIMDMSLRTGLKSLRREMEK